MPSSLNKKIKIILLALIDLVILFSSYLLAYSVRFRESIPSENLDPFWIVAPWMGLTSIIIFYLFNLYTSSIRRPLHQIIYSVVLSVLIITVLLVAMSFWARGFSFPRSIFLIGFFFHSVLMTLFRVMVWFFDYRWKGQKKVLIIGKDPDYGLQSAKKLLLHPKGWYSLYKFVPFQAQDQVKEYIKHIDVILLTPDLSKEDKTEAIRLSTEFQKEILLVPDLYDLYMSGAETQQVDDMLVFSIIPPSLTTDQRMLKRLFDILVSTVLIILLCPVMIVLFVLIPLTSKGSAMYKQERLGRNGEPYTIYKFRSMVEDAEIKTGPVLATERDPRITSVGRFIRATRLDELPQLFNVIKGDMSLVGPRPERAYFIDQFTGELPDYSYRMMVKPGITGLAQVMANYSTSVEDKLRYDLMYIKNYSFVLDLKILLLTVIVVLKRDQANGIKTGRTDFKKEIMKALDL